MCVRVKERGGASSGHMLAFGPYHISRPTGYEPLNRVCLLAV